MCVSSQSSSPLPCLMAFQSPSWGGRATGASLEKLYPTSYPALIRMCMCLSSGPPHFFLFGQSRKICRNGESSGLGGRKLHQIPALPQRTHWKCFHEDNKDLPHQVVVGIKCESEHKCCAQCLVHTPGLKSCWLNLKRYWNQWAFGKHCGLLVIASNRHPGSAGY